MNKIKIKLDEFNKRWEITDDSSYEEGFRKFKQIILNDFKYIDRYIEAEGIRLFCNIMGIEEKWRYDRDGNQFSTNIPSSYSDRRRKFSLFGRTFKETRQIKANYYSKPREIFFLVTEICARNDFYE